jgi:prepilin-type N-terminal cleavage/methylation domain-containing protein
MQKTYYARKEEMTMKRKHNEGFTLVEMLVSIVILAAIVIPTCTSLTLSFRMNAKADDMMKAQLAISSTVEKLMAEGIDANRAALVLEKNNGIYDFAWDSTNDVKIETDDYPGVSIKIEKVEGVTAYYNVTVADDEAVVEVKTQIRVATGGAGA